MPISRSQRAKFNSQDRQAVRKSKKALSTVTKRRKQTAAKRKKQIETTKKVFKAIGKGLKGVKKGFTTNPFKRKKKKNTINF